MIGFVWCSHLHLSLISFQQLHQIREDTLQMKHINHFHHSINFISSFKLKNVPINNIQVRRNRNEEQNASSIIYVFSEALRKPKFSKQILICIKNKINELWKKTWMAPTGDTNASVTLASCHSWSHLILRGSEGIAPCSLSHQFHPICTYIFLFYEHIKYMDDGLHTMAHC